MDDNQRIDADIVHFFTTSGVKIAFGPLGDSWLLSVFGGPMITLGDRSGFTVSVNPFPHAWRVSFSLNNDKQVIWFDVVESDAMKIEQLIEANERASQ